MTRKILLIAAAVAVLLGVGWYEGIYRAEVSHVKSLSAKEATTQGAMLLLRDRYVALVASEKRIPSERVALARLRGLVPDSPDLDSLVTNLFGLASKAGVQLSSISSPEPQGFGEPAAAGSAAQASGPIALDLTVSISGTAASVANFYRAIDSAPRLFVIDNYAIPLSSAGASGSPPAPGSGTSSGSGASLTIRAFYSDGSATSAAS